jgi:hypothetical protein
VSVGIVEALVLVSTDLQPYELVVVACNDKVIYSHTVNFVVVTARHHIVNSRNKVRILRWLCLLMTVEDFIVVSHEREVINLALDEDLIVMTIHLEVLLFSHDSLLLIVRVDTVTLLCEHVWLLMLM